MVVCLVTIMRIVKLMRTINEHIFTLFDWISVLLHLVRGLFLRIHTNLKGKAYLGACLPGEPLTNQITFTTFVMKFVNCLRT